MDASETLSSSVDAGASPGRRDCPRCGEPPAGTNPVKTVLFERTPLRRCVNCGTRYAACGTEPAVALECPACGLPFLTAAGTSHAEPRCPDCNLGRVPPDLPDANLAAATEREVRLALESRWRFVTSRPSSIYLNTVLRQVAKKIDGAPREPRVILLEDSEMRTLALPSGLIMISQGMLDELEDEAQLAFVLAHELAHASTGDAAARLVRLGFHAVAHEGEVREEAAWGDAAEDLVRLGYGRQRERTADERALAAVLALGYDPHSVVHYLQHVETLIERRDDRVAELSLSHPPAGERLRRVEQTLAGRVEAGEARRVNREVFRRAAGRHAGAVEPTTLGALAAAATGEAGGGAFGTLLTKLPWIGVAAVLLVLLALLISYFL